MSRMDIMSSHSLPVDAARGAAALADHPDSSMMTSSGGAGPTSLPSHSFGSIAPLDILWEPESASHGSRSGSDGARNARSPAPVRRLRIAVGLATAGRPDVACQMLVRLGRQSRPPDAILVSVPTTADIGLEAAGMPAVTLLVGARGLTRQRNAILERLDGFDLVCFLDDDFVVGDGYLAAMEQAFLRDAGLAGATGVVLADGITGAGYSFADAERVLAAARSPEVSTSEVYSAYGCNMVFSVSAVRQEGLRFDESLPRYGWLEDVDFSRRIARFGSLGRVADALGVHLGVKGGRQSGLCFGYSQIANPIYLVRKGSYVWHRAAWLMSRNVAMNLLRSARPEPHVDRRGRLAGNAAAFADLLRRRLDPERIDSLS